MRNETPLSPMSTLQDPIAMEQQIRADFDAGDLDAAATRFIQQHGGEILGFIVERAGDAAVGSEVFSEFTEDFWRGLPGFKWRTSMRSWAYTIARNAFYRHLNSNRRHRRVINLSVGSSFQIEAARLRSATLRYMKTEVKSKMRELRASLPQDDQTLLILRIDQRLSWLELAVIFSGEGDEMKDADKVRWAARLRKRFQALKDRLREMVVAEGLLD